MAVESNGNLSGGWMKSGHSPAQIQQIWLRANTVARDLSHSLPLRPFDFFGVATNAGTG
jgi:hypothetical protein